MRGRAISARAPRAEIARPRICALASPFPHAPLSLLPSPHPSPSSPLSPLPLPLTPLTLLRHHRRCRCLPLLARRRHRRRFPRRFHRRLFSRRFRRLRFPVRAPATLRRSRLCCCCCCCSTLASGAIPGIEFQGWRWRVPHAHRWSRLFPRRFFHRRLRPPASLLRPRHCCCCCC